MKNAMFNGWEVSRLIVAIHSPNSKMKVYKCLIQQLLQHEVLELVSTSHLVHRGWRFLSKHEVPSVQIFSQDMNNQNERRIELPIDFCRLLSRLRFKAESAYTIDDIDKVFKLAAKLATSKQKEAERVQAASQWFFDSLVSENKSMAFLQICFGFESLLGDDDSKGGLTDTLADRLAYLIAPSITDRAKIKKKFKELYRLRPKLVHGITNSLHSEDDVHFQWGRIALEWAIHKESKNLLSNT